MLTKEEKRALAGRIRNGEPVMVIKNTETVKSRTERIINALRKEAEFATSESEMIWFNAAASFVQRKFADHD